MTNINRVLRHLFAPIIAWMVAKGYMPEYMQGDAVEFLVLVTAAVLPMMVSWVRDVKRNQ